MEYLIVKSTNPNSNLYRTKVIPVNSLDSFWFNDDGLATFFNNGSTEMFPTETHSVYACYSILDIHREENHTLILSRKKQEK